MKIQLNQEQSKYFLEMVIPELIKIQKVRKVKEKEELTKEKSA